MSLDMHGIGSIIEGVGKVANETPIKSPVHPEPVEGLAAPLNRRFPNDLFISDEERLKIALQEKSIQADLVKGQMEIDKTETQHQPTYLLSLPPGEGWSGGNGQCCYAS